MLLRRGLERSLRRGSQWAPALACPSEAGLSHEAEWHSVPEEVQGQLLMEKEEFLNRELWKQRETYGALSLLVRRPLLDVAQGLEAADPKAPVLRWLLHGQEGSGKSTTLSQLAQLGVAKGWTLLYWPDCIRIQRPDVRRMGIAMSSRVPGRIDTPAESAQWLERFLVHNAHCLDRLRGLTLRRDYEWSRREKSEAGASVLELVELGAAKPKYASDAAWVLVKELKRAASLGQHRALVLADAVNAVFQESDVKREDGSYADTDDLTAALTVREAVGGDWAGVAVVVTTDERERVGRTLRPPTGPVSLLRAKGFELLHPFIPVHVPPLTWPEADALIDHAIAHNFLQTKACLAGPGRRQLPHLAGFNALSLTKIINSL